MRPRVKWPVKHVSNLAFQITEQNMLSLPVLMRDGHSSTEPNILSSNSVMNTTKAILLKGSLSAARSVVISSGRPSICNKVWSVDAGGSGEPRREEALL